MTSKGDYPLGADTPDAPWNEKNPLVRTAQVEVKLTLPIRYTSTRGESIEEVNSIMEGTARCILEKFKDFIDEINILEYE